MVVAAHGERSTSTALVAKGGRFVNKASDAVAHRRIGTRLVAGDATHCNYLQPRIKVHRPLFDRAQLRFERCLAVIDEEEALTLTRGVEKGEAFGLAVAEGAEIATQVWL